jgi:hypothetical protein
LILILGAFVLCPARSARAFANIQIGSSNPENLSFALYNTTPGSDGSPVFNGGLMTSAGSHLFPNLGSTIGTVQNYSNTFTTAYTQNLSANQNPPFPTPLPSSFGAATVSAAASTALPKNGTSMSQQIGVSFNSGTFLQSATTLTAGQAAVSFGYLHAGFVNSTTGLGAGPFTGVPGSVISATGVLSLTAGSFVELANQGNILVKDNHGNTIANDSFTIIVGFALDSTLHQSTFVYGTGTTTLSAPDPSTGAFSIKDSNAFSSVTIPEGGSFTVDSYLTLVSDPGSLIQLGDLTNMPGPIPDFGSYLGGPPPAGQSIPEPASLVQLATALVLVAGLLRWRGCLRNRRPRRLLRRVRSAAAAAVGLALFVLAPGLAPAGTITVNDLSLPLSASSESFSTSSVSINSVTEVVTFDGTYMSAGGFPGIGQSVSYTVVYVDPDDSTSDLTQLTITGITPTSQQNVSVQMLFEGLVQGPVTPGPGIYFIPEPDFSFDVAGYLRGQQAPGVPTDLSVLVASQTPEPASLLLGGIALVVGIAFALWRRLGA